MTGRGTEIRPMRIDDLRDVFLLGRELLPSGGPAARAWNEKNLAATLAAGLEWSFVAVLKKKVLGCIIAAPDEGEAGGPAVSIAWLCARPADGIREALLDALLREAADRNRPRIRAEIIAENSELSGLFKKFGFTESKHLLIMENFPRET